jgi:hypothetical protein
MHYQQAAIQNYWKSWRIHVVKRTNNYKNRQWALLPVSLYYLLVHQHLELNTNATESPKISTTKLFLPGAKKKFQMSPLQPDNL